MGIGDSPDNPSSLVRRVRCEDPVIYKTEGCNRSRSWKEDNKLIKYFIGMADEGYSIDEEQAEKILSKWRDNWANPKFDNDML